MPTNDADATTRELAPSPRVTKRWEAARRAADADVLQDKRLCQLLDAVDELLAARNATQHRIATLTALLRSLSRATLTDTLTGLRNRRGFMRDGNRLLSLAAKRIQPVAVFYFDVDRLKLINDSHGHAAGDDALRAAAMALRATFRLADVVGRLGGDEFAAVALVRRDTDGRLILGRLQQFLSLSKSTCGGLAVWLSAGLTICGPGTPASLAELLDDADAMMRRNKRARSAANGFARGWSSPTPAAAACDAAE